MVDLFKMNHEGLGFFGLDNKDFSKEKLIVITGSNASGKSLLRRIVSNNGRKNNLLVADLSHERRTTQDITRAFLYGDENSDSTGNITASSLIGLFRTSAKWNENHLLIIDEPEIGLGEEAQMGMGIYIREKIESASDKLHNIVIFTHSRYILEELNKIDHHYHHVGNEYKSIEEFNNRELFPLSPVQLNDISNSTFGVIDGILNRAKDEREKTKK